MTTTSHISTSGGLISTAFIENIRQARTNQRGTQPDTYELPWQEAPKSPAALEARIAKTWEALLERWDAIATELTKMDISQARDRWILPLLRAFDFQPIYQRSDIVLDDSETLRFNISHFGWETGSRELGVGSGEKDPTAHSPFPTPPPIHTVSPTANLDARTTGATNSRSPKGKSPHDMLQLFLNVSRGYRWAVLTNGLHLHLLRDYHHTYTKGYVEFDLESIFETRNFADFRALYRMTHASRFVGLTPPPELSETSEFLEISGQERWESAPLEMFYRDSQAAGIQVGADLQKQVREAIEMLGNGFLASSFQLSAGNREWGMGNGEKDPPPHSLLPTPYSLLQALQQDAALCQRFYAELLHIVYRILFLLYAEQRGMVPKIGAPLETLYRQGYSLTALRTKAESDPTSPEAYDLWEGLKVTFKMFQKGADGLGVYRYNGMLFAEDQTPLLDGNWEWGIKEGSGEWGIGSRGKDSTPHSPFPTPSQSKKSGEEKNEPTADQFVPGSQRVAGGDEAGGTMLSTDQNVSEGGTVRDDLTDQESGGLSSGQHRRGLRPGEPGRVYPISADRPGVTQGVGDSPDALGASRTGEQASSPTDSDSMRDRGQDASSADPFPPAEKIGSRELGVGNREKGPTAHSPLPTPSLRCRNLELLRAVRALTLIERERALQRISYADLNVEEIGGIYESLLDFAPRVTTGAEDVDGRAIPPNTFFLDPRGTARKTTGSYYTHPSLVNALIESALMPVLEDRLKEVGSREWGMGNGEKDSTPYSLFPTPSSREAAENAILSLKVCDPAMGSGHFLIAANNALALRLAQIRTGDEYPAERELRQARRDVLVHCIYGVDLNPMAVELCKVALWINAAVDDAPLSFLDHHLKCGNSLIGATPDLLDQGIPDDAFQPVTGDDPKVAAAVRKRNKQERAGQLSLWRVTILKTLTDLDRWRELNQLAEAEPQIAERRYAEYRADPAYRHNKLVADLWTAAFFWPLTEGEWGMGSGEWGKSNIDLIPTEELFRQAQADPALVPGRIKEQAAQLAERHKFFHWHLEFPDVFQAVPNGNGELGIGSGENTPTPHSPLPTPGFDVVLGNPPWERLNLQEKEFFAARDPEVASAPTSATRRRTIKALKKTKPELWSEYRASLRDADAASKFMHDAGRYPFTGRGDVNTYAIFAELVRDTIRHSGRAGLIVQSGVAIDKTYSDFFIDLVEKGEVVSLYDFVNREGIFPGIHRTHPHFCALTLEKPGNIKGPIRLAFFLTNPDHLSDLDRQFSLSTKDLSLLNPNTRTCPIFRSRRDADLTIKIYHNTPVLVNEKQRDNPWDVEVGRMFHSSGDSNLFVSYNEVDEELIRLYESKYFWQFDHRYAANVDNTHTEVAIVQKLNPEYIVKTRFAAHRSTIPKKFIDKISDWYLSYRVITNSTNERTIICAILPKCGLIHSVNTFYGISPLAACLVGSNLNSFSTDYLCRQSIGGTNLSIYTLFQLPILPPDRYTPELLAFIVPRVLELTYTAWDLRAFADDVWAEAGSGELGIGNSGGNREWGIGSREKSPTPHSPLPTPLQDAILRQWQANREATHGGHEGAVPPAWAEGGHRELGIGNSGGNREWGIGSREKSPTPHSPFPKPPFKWDETRRAQLRADLDGLYGHLYGLTRDELAYILDTFPIVRRKDEAQYGEYRTKRMVIEAYDNWNDE